MLVAVCAPQTPDNGSISFQPSKVCFTSCSLTILASTAQCQSYPILLRVIYLYPWLCRGMLRALEKLKITTIVLNNPFTSKSAQNLRIFGIGMMDDNKQGTRRLLQAENRDFLNGLLRLRGSEKSLICALGPAATAAQPFDIRMSPILVCDLACFRHCEHLTNGGFCGCPREALRTVLKPPANGRSCLPSWT
eukprot:6195151-Pleurochrysis_carterae.AAC.2